MPDTLNTRDGEPEPVVFYPKEPEPVFKNPGARAGPKKNRSRSRSRQKCSAPAPYSLIKKNIEYIFVFSKKQNLVDFFLHKNTTE